MKVSGTSSVRMLACALALVVINLPMGGTAGGVTPSARWI